MRPRCVPQSPVASMREKDTVLKTEEQQDEIELFGPYSVRFVSQNKRNDFLGAHISSHSRTQRFTLKTAGKPHQTQACR